MFYNKRTWATGNVVGAVDLNRMEQGIEDAGSGQVLVVNAVYNGSDDSYTLDKTWQEISDAFPFVIECFNRNGMNVKTSIASIGINNGIYNVEGNTIYRTSSASGYPTTATEESPLGPSM